MAPNLLPAGRAIPGEAHGTTVLAVHYRNGVIMAGDRRATAGNLIAQRDLRKVHPADESSAIAFAGSVGIAVEMVRLFQTELEHYEKVEGTTLSLDGKANRLGSLVRSNVPLADQGLAVIPLFAGYDSEVGRIFSYDITGGRQEHHDYYAVGSGSFFAQGAIKKLFRTGLDEDDVIRICVRALFDAADDDSATGGPDFTRGLYPNVLVVSAEGVREVPDDEVAAVARDIVEHERNGRHTFAKRIPGQSD